MDKNLPATLRRGAAFIEDMMRRKNPDYIRWTPWYVEAMREAADELERPPIADVAPVVHGRWEAHPNHYGFDRCSVCCDCIVEDDWVDGVKWNYCPNCGAKMDMES